MQNISATAPRNDLASVSSTSLQTPSASGTRVADENAPAGGQDEAFTVRISSEASARGAAQQVPAESSGRSADLQGQQPDASSVPEKEPGLNREPAVKGERNETDTQTSSSPSTPSAAEQRSNSREEQAERQIVNTQTIRNYANASLKSQINGGRILDEEV